MKKLFSLKLFFACMLACAFAFSLQSCDDDEEEATPQNLDAALFGTWSFTDSEGDVLSWTFLSDGSCLQGIYGDTVNWKWAIEDGLLKFYVDGGIPSLRRYKIEGNLLYLYVDQIDDWGLPFTKQ